MKKNRKCGNKESPWDLLRCWAQSTPQKERGITAHPILDLSLCLVKETASSDSRSLRHPFIVLSNGHIVFYFYMNADRVTGTQWTIGHRGGSKCWHGWRGSCFGRCEPFCIWWLMQYRKLFICTVSVQAGLHIRVGSQWLKSQFCLHSVSKTTIGAYWFTDQNLISHTDQVLYFQFHLDRALGK